MKNKILVIILLIGLVFIAGCGKSTTNNSRSTTAKVPAPGNEDVEEMIVNTGEVKEFEIVATNWKFSPSLIEVNKGDKVELHLQSTEGTHGFALLEFDVSETLREGEDIHVEFIADKIGTFNFFCMVPCGKGHSGMNGLLVVKD